MAGFTISKQIDASPEAVFAVLVDVAKMPERIPEITKIELLTPGPIGVGSKIAETRLCSANPPRKPSKSPSSSPNAREYDLPVHHKVRATLSSDTNTKK